MNTPKVVIGLIGEQWSGKDTFARLIKREVDAKKAFLQRLFERLLKHERRPKAAIIRFSAILTKTLDQWDIPSNLRKNRRMLFEAMKERFGHYGNPLVNVVKQQIIASNADVVILNSLKWPDDVEMVRRFPRNIIVYVTAALEKRYERCQISKGKRPIIHSESYAEFVLDETDPGDMFITQIGKKNADVIIYNNGTMEEFVREAKKFFKEKIATVM